jgi:hypothetical protein
MTARDVFPGEMDPFELDPATAEGLLRGVVDTGDAPPEYRAVARTLGVLREAPEYQNAADDRGAVERIAAAVVPERRARPRKHSIRFSAWALKIAAAIVFFCGVGLTGELASAGSLPKPAQHFASTVLGEVGISVPTGGENPTVVPAPPSTTSQPVPSPTASSDQPGAGAGAPGPDAAPAPADLPSTTAPGHGQIDVHGTQDLGTPPGTAKRHANPRPPNDQAPASPGNGQRP